MKIFYEIKHKDDLMINLHKMTLDCIQIEDFTIIGGENYSDKITGNGYL